MTREEAIDKLQDLSYEVYNEDSDGYSYARAIDMAIDALKTIDNCDQCEWCCPSDGIPTIHVLRCKDCQWYEPSHILHNDGTKTYVDEDAEWVTSDVGINVGGQCIHHPDLKIYCTAHNKESGDDFESIVIFRKPNDFCSYGERKEP